MISLPSMLREMTVLEGKTVASDGGIGNSGSSGESHIAGKAGAHSEEV